MSAVTQYNGEKIWGSRSNTKCDISNTGREMAIFNERFENKYAE